MNAVKTAWQQCYMVQLRGMSGPSLYRTSIHLARILAEENDCGLNSSSEFPTFSVIRNPEPLSCNPYTARRRDYADDEYVI